jgi:hypothetical protein
MRSRLEWLERLAANAEVATVLGSIPASSDTVESEGRQIKQFGIQYIEEKNPKNSPCKKRTCVWHAFLCQTAAAVFLSISSSMRWMDPLLLTVLQGIATVPRY